MAQLLQKPLIFATCLWCSETIAQTPLPIPDTLSGSVIDLTLQEATWEFHPGEVVNTYGYNGSLLGPTLILNQGQAVTLNVTNALPDLTTTHWHGMHVSPANDGGPHSLIYPNTTWSPSFTVLDRAGTYWYHPHGHGLTDYQVSMGAAGMILVRDAAEAAVALLPKRYGVDEFPLIIQAKAIVAGQIAMHTGLDSVITVNGVREPQAEFPAQVVRLRCVNGSSERSFFLGLSNGATFFVAGTDGGLLSAPEPCTRVPLMPGERLDLLLDLTAAQGTNFELMAFNSELPTGVIGGPQVGNGMATLDGYLDNALNGADHRILGITVGPATVDPILIIPPYLVPLFPLQEADAQVTRSFTFEPQGTMPMEVIEGPFTINGALMDMDSINVVVSLGSTEIWSFTNNTMVGHPIHIHDVQFNILDRNGMPLEAWESGWKDVVYVPAMGGARVLMRFDDFADPDMPYMYHCHLLMHEDEGMMGQFLVVDPTSIGEAADVKRVMVWPNPSADGHLMLSVPGSEGQGELLVNDALGRLMFAGRLAFTAGNARVVLPALAPGNYTLRITDQHGVRHSAHVALQH